MFFSSNRGFISNGCVTTELVTNWGSYFNVFSEFKVESLLPFCSVVWPALWTLHFERFTERTPRVRWKFEFREKKIEQFEAPSSERWCKGARNKRPSQSACRIAGKMHTCWNKRSIVKYVMAVALNNNHLYSVNWSSSLIFLAIHLFTPC